MQTRNLSEWKAQGDGLFDNTGILETALRECAGKAMLLVDGGVFLSGPLQIPSHTHLSLSPTATLKFTDSFAAYPPVLTRWEGVDCYAMHPLLWINGQTDVVIEGKGTIDGNGQAWWANIKLRRATQKEPMLDVEKRLAALNPGYQDQPGGGGGRQCQFLRPPLFQVYKSDHIVVKDVTLTNSPFWTCHTVYSSDLAFEGLHVCNPSDSPNTDGMDIESCTHITIDRCTVDVGDDGIALKSGSGKEGIKAAKPTSDVLMRDCLVRNAHGGFVIGSETAGGVHSVRVEHCRFLGTDRGVRIKTRRGRGGEICGIAVDDVVMDNVICPITINMYYKYGGKEKNLFSLEKQPVDNTTPNIQDISISHVNATNCRASAGFIVGLPEAPVRNVSIRDSKITVTEKKEDGLEIEMYQGLQNSDYRGIRVQNAEVSLQNCAINVQPAVMDMS